MTGCPSVRPRCSRRRRPPRLHIGRVSYIGIGGMLVQTHIARRLDEGDLWQGSVLDIGHQLRSGSKLIRHVIEDILSIGELVQVAFPVKAGWRGTATRVRMDIDFPAYAVVLQKLDDGFIR